ncbi:MAG: hypothetical protein FWD78_16315 [Treponema sp.]|nr:hypothetical protein [Treponema sp.]
MSFRTIAKFLFILVIIGFCMPMSCDKNGFEIASSGLASSALIFALYVIFIFAIFGVIVGVILAAGKKVPVIIDWVILIACILGGIIPFFYNLNGYEYQSGVYFIMVGYILILIFQIISAVKKESN